MTSVEPVAAGTMTAWQITTSGAPGVVEAINALLPLGYAVQINAYVEAGSSTTIWVMTISMPGYPTLQAVPSDWIVIQQTVSGLGGAAVYTNTQYTSLFQAATPPA